MNLAAVGPLIASGPRSAASQQKQPAISSGKAQVEGAVPSQVELENEFISRYQKATGQQPYSQYFDDVDMPDGSKRRALGYKIGEQMYFPAKHGVDWAFQHLERLGQIPNQMDVAMKRFIPGGGRVADQQQETQPQMTPPASDPRVALSEPGTGETSMVNPNQPPEQQNLLLQLLNQGPGTNHLTNKANKLRTDAAGIKPEEAKYKFGGPGAIVAALGALFGGDYAGDFIKGLAGGVMNTRVEDQQRNDLDAKTRSQQMMTQAQAIEDEANNKNAEWNRKLAVGQYLQTDEFKKTQEDNKQLRSEAALSGKLTTTQWSQLMKISPEGRADYARSVLGVTDPAALAALAQANPGEEAKMAQANLSNERANDLVETRPLRKALIESQTDANKFNTLFTQARTATQKVATELEKLKVEWFPKEQSAKLAKLSADTEKARTEANHVGQKVFNPDGSIRPTATSYVTQWSKFQTAADKADSETIEKQALLGRLQAQFDANKKLIDTPVKDPFAIDAAAQSRNKAVNSQPKLQQQIDALSAEIEGLKFISNKNRENLSKLQGFAKTGVGAGSMSETDARSWLNANKGKMTPEQLQQARAAFAQQFGKNP